MKNRICFYCGKKIEDKYKMIGLDIPYINLFFHSPECWGLIRENLYSYLADNKNRLYEVVESGKAKR